MASFVGAITEFNPYIQQIPTEAYTKVGMYKEQMYESGVRQTQETIDRIAGLDIANEGGRRYLHNRVDELTKTLNKYSSVDLSDPNNVSQLVSLAKPLYQDENIVADVINTGIYRKWSKEANDAFKAGKMELGQYMRETTDANIWLGSQSAGAQYTGRSTPNTATKKDLLDRVIKAKKDGMEKSEYVYDINYSKDTPYYVKSTNKYYSEAEFNNFVSESVMSAKDREVLMNEHWYENAGKPTDQLQLEDIMMYTAKIDANNREIDRISEMPKFLSGEAKVEYQKTIDDLTAYNKQLKDGKIKYLQSLNLNDPSSRDVFHRDLSEARFINSLDVLTDEVRKEELQKNDQWFKDKELEIEMAKEAMKARAAGTTGKAKTPQELIDEVAVYTPVDPTAPRTEVSLNTIRTGYQIKNDQINAAMNGLIGKMMENGVDMRQFMATDASGNLAWDQVQVGGKAGASMNIPRFKSPADKERFYNLVAGLNYAYTKEAEDGKLDNHSFTDYVKTNFTDYRDDDPNSKFKLSDKIVTDALNTLKGTSALLPRLDKLFADKGVVRTMAQIDEALKDKKDMANAYREALYKSNALTGPEMQTLRGLTDDQILSNSYFLDKDMEARRAGQDKKITYATVREPDGTWSIYQDIYDNSEAGGFTRFLQGLAPESGTSDIGLGRHLQRNKLAGGYKDKISADNAERQEGQLQLYAGLSRESLEKADAFVKQTYSYVQENVASTVQNLKEDKPAYAAIQDGLTLFMNRARLQASPEDILIEDGTIDPRTLSGISKLEILGATVSNTEDIFNPNPMYDVQFSATTGQGTKEEKTSTYNGRVSLRSFLATNPNYKTSEYAKYFAPALYAQKEAYANIKAAVNPLEGSEASYAPRQDIEPVFNRTNVQGQAEFSNDSDTSFAWETLPIERDGKQTMISYQVVSLGQNTILGNVRNRDGQQYAPGAFYVKLKVPTSTGDPKIIFLKRPSGDSHTFNSAANAHYAVRDLIFNNPEIKLDEIDPKTGQANYFTVDPTTLRGIFNAQLSYNGYSKLEPVKIVDAIGRQQTIQQAKELQFGSGN